MSENTNTKADKLSHSDSLLSPHIQLITEPYQFSISNTAKKPFVTFTIVLSGHSTEPVIKHELNKV